MAKPAKKQEVALRKSHDVEVLTDKPEWLTGQARGSEEVGLNDLILPRIELVQPLSPCKDKNDAAFIPGIEDGDLFNTVSRENYGEGVRIVPVYYRPVFLLFKTRKAGGGFRGTFETAEAAEAARKRLEDPQNHEIVQCGEHIVLVMTAEGPQQAILSMTKTKLKVSRQLNSLVRMRHPDDSFSTLYQLGSVQQKNDKGTFYNFTVKPLGYVNKDVFMAGERLHAMLRSGTTVRASYDDADAIDGDADAEM